MTTRRAAEVSYLMILLLQGLLFYFAVQWLPGFIQQLLTLKSSAGGDQIVANLSLAFLVVSPVFLLLAPYAVAHAFWVSLGQKHPGPQLAWN